jgi:hypothetical protein
MVGDTIKAARQDRGIALEAFLMRLCDALHSGSAPTPAGRKPEKRLSEGPGSPSG